MSVEDTKAADFAPVPMYPLGRDTTAFKLKATLMDSVVRRASVSPAASGAVRTACRAVPLSVVIEAVPPDALNVPMFATPLPMIVMVVSTGRGTAEDAVRVKPGLIRPRVPHVPRFTYAPTSMSAVVDADASGAATAAAIAGTAHAVFRIIERRSVDFSSGP
ncbi:MULTISPECIES: hypothetical protein [unclassified Pseudoclavibacter]|uniref:hypothetical protein n=1 Tax=unclassified Pseudoclavibacter TaxID=2615177 RepID=UPI001BA64714|nr:hypothetical protein [Pseudoclavibacter sp. Marseille-Q4354]MBS3180128.1 hypothetical protein [Pseudoclavibacter sp. Marseille-Q4354]